MNIIDYLWLDEKFDELSHRPKKVYTDESGDMKNKRVVQPEAEKVLLSWSAPARPFKRRTREFYITLVSVVALLGSILFLIEGAMPVVLMGSLLFLFYVLSTVEPDHVTHEVTNFGVRFAGRLTNWDTLGRFWFTQRWGTNMVVFEVFALPGRLELVIDKEFRPKLEEVLKKYLVHQEVPPGFLDKASNWASRKLPQS